MRSNDMVRIYGTKNMPYTEEFSEGLKEYQTVEKSEKATLKDLIKDKFDQIINDANDKVADLEQKLEDAKNELNETVDKILSDSNDKVSGLQDELGNTQAALDEAKKQADAANKDAANKLSALEKQIAELTSSLNAAKQEVQTLKAAAADKAVKTEIKTNKSKYQVKKGKKVTIKVTVSNADGKKVTYKSSNKKIATVSSKGVVKGKKKGTATITIKCNGVSKKVKVTVK